MTEAVSDERVVIDEMLEWLVSLSPRDRASATKRIDEWRQGMWHPLIFDVIMKLRCGKGIQAA